MRPSDRVLSFLGQPSRSLPREAVQPVSLGHGGLTTGEEYRLLAGGADEATGVGSALGYVVYVDFCLCRGTGECVSQGARGTAGRAAPQPTPNT